MDYLNNIKVSFEDEVCTIKLDRAEKRNALDEQTMDELTDTLQRISMDKTIRMVVMVASGDDFCAGADLDWMRTTQGLDEKQLTAQNMKLQRCFQLWLDLPAFTVALVQGNVVGGGIGLVAAADMAVACLEAKFRFSEVTLGLIPATIAPFVLQRTTSRFIRNAMLTARPFDANEALHHGLIDRIADKEKMEYVVEEITELLDKVEPTALAIGKALLNDISQNRIQEPMNIYTSRLLAQVRKTEIAGRRIGNFLNIVNRRHESK